jgi:hypothetical protein
MTTRSDAADAKADKADAKAEAARAGRVGTFAKHLGHRVEITAAYDDDTVDVQRVDEKDAVVLDANGQPQWTPRVAFAELT